jgi:hypothetical protein
MTEYRIVELHRRFHIEERIVGMAWIDTGRLPNVPRFFDSLADARSWVATIKKGVVYHDAEDATDDKLQFLLDRVGKDIYRVSPTGGYIGEPIRIISADHARHIHRHGYSVEYYVDAPNLAQDERKSEDDTSDGIKPLEWFKERIGKKVYRNGGVTEDGCATFVILSHLVAVACFNFQSKYGFRYSDPL